MEELRSGKPHNKEPRKGDTSGEHYHSYYPPTDQVMSPETELARIQSHVAEIMEWFGVELRQGTDNTPYFEHCDTIPRNWRLKNCILIEARTESILKLDYRPEKFPRLEQLILDVDLPKEVFNRKVQLSKPRFEEDWCILNEEDDDNLDLLSEDENLPS